MFHSLGLSLRVSAMVSKDKLLFWIKYCFWIKLYLTIVIYWFMIPLCNSLKMCTNYTCLLILCIKVRSFNARPCTNHIFIYHWLACGKRWKWGRNTLDSGLIYYRVSSLDMRSSFCVPGQPIVLLRFEARSQRWWASQWNHATLVLSHNSIWKTWIQPGNAERETLFMHFGMLFVVGAVQ